MSVVEELSGISVDDVLQLRKKKQFLFSLCVCFLYAFAYVFYLGLPSKFVVDNKT